MKRARRRLLRAAVVSIVAMAVGPVSIAVAASPEVTITSPLNGSVTNDQTPSFSGTTYDLFNETTETPNEVKLAIYAGTIVEGNPVETLPTAPFLGSTWTVGPAKALVPGTYTAQAEQVDELGKGKSLPVTFTVDTTPPQVTVTSPANGSSTSSSSQQVVGSAGTAKGDKPEITIQLFAGSTIGAQASLLALTVRASSGSWSGTFGGLNPGTYTIRAEQGDEAGNTGKSGAVTFTVTRPVPVTPSSPVASFRWFPTVPHTGGPVLLVSSSTDATSPITAFAWALTSNGPFRPGKPVINTSFSTPGAHIVRLRVTAADGLTSVASETIRVTRPPLVLMQPFPIVRIAGSETSNGANISVLTVQAPVGARVTVTCQGPSCPTRSESRIAFSSRRKGRGTAQIAFRHFERLLRTGVILEIRISKHREIGKYTRFVIRQGRLPERVDTCLGPAGIKPIACPAS